MAKRGPGKFSSDLDAALYDLTLDGADEECGSVQDVGFWAGLLRDGNSVADALRDDTELSDADVRKMRECAGMIVEEDEQGFVTVGYYKSEEALEKEWENCESDAEQAEDEGDFSDGSGGGDEDYDSDYSDE